MSPHDPLSSLLRGWQPRSPFTSGQITGKVMRQIRNERMDPWGMRLARYFGDFVEEWLPSPNIWAPIIASVILLLAILQWQRGLDQAKAQVALQWHEQLSSPLAKISLRGAYADLAKIE